MRIDRREPGTRTSSGNSRNPRAVQAGIDQNLESDDYQAHYDLGVAFKEMGLLDEAIAEFQKALRAPDGRLRTSEALGIAFFDKGQFTVSGRCSAARWKPWPRGTTPRSDSSIGSARV